MSKKNEVILHMRYIDEIEPKKWKQETVCISSLKGVYIGRSERCDITIHSRYFARIQFYIWIESRDGTLYIKNLGINQASINDEIMTEAIPLAGGEIIKLGSVKLYIDSIDASVSIPSASNSQEEIRAFEKQSDIESNMALFRRFEEDLRNDKLPVVSNPTLIEILSYTLKRRIVLRKKEFLSDALDKKKLRSNFAIPVEVDIWVDKVYSYYFDTLIPVMGLIHFCESSRAELYKYKGYSWYTVEELYPTVYFD